MWTKGSTPVAIRYGWLSGFLSTMRQQFTPIRTVKIKTSDNTKCWQVHEETESLIHCWWKDKNSTDILEDSSVQSLSHVQLFVTPWITAVQSFCHWRQARVNTGILDSLQISPLITPQVFVFTSASNLSPSLLSPNSLTGNWTVKKAEHQRIDAFELWCLRRLLRVPWTARRSKQSILGDLPWVFIGRTDAET